MKKRREIRQLVWLLACLLGAWNVSGQDFVPKREFRAAWIATLSGIDWPSRAGLSVEQQQREYVRILDTLVACGMNAVIVQVRPKADAFYASKTEPWSQFLTGTRDGDPGYDPLAFMLEQAHRRGLELHVWLNPFRVTTGEDLSVLSPRSVGRRHPEWLVRYVGRWYLDPGRYEVRSYLLSVVAEIVRGYDVDAIHMDDYFYPYPQGGQPFPDGKTYQRYGASLFDDVSQWRRDNVNRLIKGISDTIRALRPGVKFGISPFGIYRNASDDPSGSATRGLSNYDDLYADVALWVREGWIDYVLPQLYWENGHSAADFGELLRWWGLHHGRSQLYIGHGAFNISPRGKNTVWRTAEEICRQVRMQRENPSAAGSAFYSARYLVGNAGGLTDSLKMRYYRHPALVPAMPWLDPRAPLPPERVQVEKTPQGMRVSWQAGRRESLGEADPPAQVRYYVVYRFSADQMVNINDASHIVARVWGDASGEYTDTSAPPGQVVYVVTSVSAAGVENEDFSVAAPAGDVRGRKE